MITKVETINESEPLIETLIKLSEKPFTRFVVLNKEDIPTGTISINSPYILQAIMASQHEDMQLQAFQLASIAFSHNINNQMAIIQLSLERYNMNPKKYSSSLNSMQPAITKIIDLVNKFQGIAFHGKDIDTAPYLDDQMLNLE